MVRCIYAYLCGDGSHSHQPGPAQGIGVSCWVDIRVVETEYTYYDDDMRPFHPVAETISTRYCEYKMSSHEFCTPAVPEFMAIIVSLFHGLPTILEVQSEWQVPNNEIRVKIYSDSHNALEYLNGQYMQVPWLAIMMELTQTILRQFRRYHIKFEFEWIPREHLFIMGCDRDATNHRERHSASVNIHPWIEARLRNALTQCSIIKIMLQPVRFHCAAGIKHTNWVYIPAGNLTSPEDRIFNMNACFHSPMNETFMHWYLRH